MSPEVCGGAVMGGKDREDAVVLESLPKKEDIIGFVQSVEGRKSG